MKHIVRKNPCRRIHRGFTLIELVTVIVILGVLSVVAFPDYLDYRTDAKETACRGSLGGMRSAIANIHVFQGSPSGGGTMRYPTIGELAAAGTMMQSELPPNPYDDDSTPNNVTDATGIAIGTVVETSKGWAYNPMAGEIWANNNSAGGKTTLENSL